MNLTALAADLAHRVPDLARECVTNREAYILHALTEALAETQDQLRIANCALADLKCSLGEAQKEAAMWKAGVGGK